MNTNGKILEFFKSHWRGIILVVSLGLFCAAVLYGCQNGAEFLVKNNKVIITKSKNK